jgi:3-isopropylmalate/(R)-2-methylmalate dehydratase large subunit
MSIPAVMIDMSFLATERRNILKVHDPDKIAVVYDHMVPAPDERSAEAHAYGRDFVRRFGLKRSRDVGPDQGISHAGVADRAYAGNRAGVQRLAHLRFRRVQLRGARRRRA